MDIGWSMVKFIKIDKKNIRNFMEQKTKKNILIQKKKKNYKTSCRWLKYNLTSSSESHYMDYNLPK